MASTRLGPDSLVRQHPAVLSADVGEVVVVLQAEQNAYYDTDSVGADVWRRIVAPTAVSDICRALVAGYDVDPQTCEADVLAFLEEALREGIVSLEDSPAASTA